MSSDHQTDDPSQPTDPPLGDPALIELVRERGEPLLEGLEKALPGARAHADDTAAYAFATAVALGFSREQAELCRETARLGNIGKIYGPPEIHHEAGSQLARGAGLPAMVCEWLRGTGERYDGSGPGSLSGSEIPVFSRIVQAAKRCDELLSQGSPPADLRALAGTELDPAMVDALASMLERAGGAE
jgi:HD-GYP domain-containing protein (c-di-GMP phosphodiesterase class II)